MSALPRPGAAVPLRGSPAALAFGRWMLRTMGWQVVGELPDLPKFVIAIAPHTSNWDFIVGASVMFALDLRVTFIGKHTLFRGPFGPLMRWMGGVPIDRTKAHGTVGESVAAFAAVPSRILAIAPQGTRSARARYRSGFLHIARGAGVPVVLAAIDYATRTVHLGPTIFPSADVEEELRRCEAHFAAFKGKRG